jgi:hypothetical protein
MQKGYDERQACKIMVELLALAHENLRRINLGAFLVLSAMLLTRPQFRCLTSNLTTSQYSNSMIKAVATAALKCRVWRLTEFAAQDAIIVIFVHGWKHDARSDDSNLASS